MSTSELKFVMNKLNVHFSEQVRYFTGINLKALKPKANLRPALMLNSLLFQELQEMILGEPSSIKFQNI